MMAAGSQVSMTELLETQQKIVDELANKFRNIAVLAAESREEEDVTGLEAAAKTMQINVESQALIHAGEAYLSFNRRLKELWLFGRIREIGEGEDEDSSSMGPDSMKVAGMVEKLIQAQRCGGKADGLMLTAHEIGKADEREKQDSDKSARGPERTEDNGDAEMS